MRHSNTLWMLAIVTAIFVLIFLNLVLGSVSIPLQSVWHIIWNLGNEPITWQNIIWKSTTGIDSVGSGSWLIHQRLTDANRFP